MKVFCEAGIRWGGIGKCGAGEHALACVLSGRQSRRVSRARAFPAKRANGSLTNGKDVVD